MFFAATAVATEPCLPTLLQQADYQDRLRYLGLFCIQNMFNVFLMNT